MEKILEGVTFWAQNERMVRTLYFGMSKEASVCLKRNTTVKKEVS